MTTKKKNRPGWSKLRRLRERQPTRAPRGATPPLEPKKLEAPPKKCDKCGNIYIDVYVERFSASQITMAQCLGARGGCGKTWRLI